MYHYKGLTQDRTTGMSKSGNLIDLLVLASRVYKRQGMIGQIVRPDGTELRDKPRKINFPLELVFRTWE